MPIPDDLVSDIRAAAKRKAEAAVSLHRAKCDADDAERQLELLLYKAKQPDLPTPSAPEVCGCCGWHNTDGAKECSSCGTSLRGGGKE